MSELLCYTEEIISDHLRKIQTLFIPGVRLTLIARDPNCDTADFLLTGDNLLEVAKLIQRRMTPEEISRVEQIRKLTDEDILSTIKPYATAFGEPYSSKSKMHRLWRGYVLKFARALLAKEAASAVPAPSETR